MTTGVDLLRQELIKRGYTKQQAHSKVVMGVLDVLANAGTTYEDLEDAEEMLRSVKRQVYQITPELSDLQRKRSMLWDEIQNLNATINQRVWAQLSKVVSEQRDYLKEVMRTLEECETPEGRDTLRKAQMFVNTVDVDTKYDNTAYIIGLSAILSGGKVAPVKQLKKINTKLFDGYGDDDDEEQ